MSRTHYEILGVARTATSAEIKSAYRKLCKTAHPDMGGNAALFGIIQEAYDVLSNDAQRALYDAELSRPSGGSAQRPPSGASYTYPRTRPTQEHPRSETTEDAFRRAQEQYTARPAPEAPSPGHTPSATPRVRRAPRFPFSHRLAVGGCAAVIVVASSWVSSLVTGANLALRPELTSFLLVLGAFVVGVVLSGLVLRRGAWRPFPLSEKVGLFWLALGLTVVFGFVPLAQFAVITVLLLTAYLLAVGTFHSPRRSTT